MKHLSIRKLTCLSKEKPRHTEKLHTESLLEVQPGTLSNTMKHYETHRDTMKHTR